MKKARKRKHNPHIPSHIDQAVLPAAIYFDHRGSGVWYTSHRDEHGKQCRRNVAPALFAMFVAVGGVPDPGAPVVKVNSRGEHGLVDVTWDMRIVLPLAGLLHRMSASYRSDWPGPTPPARLIRSMVVQGPDLPRNMRMPCWTRVRSTSDRR